MKTNLLFALPVLLLAACSGGGNAPDAAEATATPAAPVAPAAADADDDNDAADPSQDHHAGSDAHEHAEGTPNDHAH